MTRWLPRLTPLALLPLLAGCATTVAERVPGSIPALAWTARSDWQSVTAAGAVGDGVADDTAAIQKVFDGVVSGAVIYFPAGTYRLTATLRLQPATRVTGVWIVGHGRDTRLVWDGPAGQPLWLDHGIAHSRYTGLLFDGRGRAAVGLHHQNQVNGFETEVDHRHLAFLSFTDTGLLASGAPATAEVLVENCLFENCGRGAAFLNFNDYDWTFDGCEFRSCGTAVQCRKGNTYIRNCHFTGSREVDIWLDPEHGSSVRRCTSLGSRQFLHFSNPVAPLTVQDCQVAAWTNPECAISIGTAPAVIFDTVFRDPPGSAPPVQIRAAAQRLFVSQNRAPDNDGVWTPGVGKVYEIPAGTRGALLRHAGQRFLRHTAPVPTRVFDAKADFGAKGDGRADDTEALQNTINAARTHGRGAIAYLPTGTYVVTRPLRVTGADYTVGGTGFKSGLAWKGPEGGAIIEVVDPQRIVLENLAVGNHDVGQDMTNACDILQTGTAPGSEITYDDVCVFGMYQKQPFRQGLCLRELAPGSVVRATHVQGNIRLQDAARATVLLGNSYEGSLVVAGQARERDGFLGILTRLGTICTHALYVRDNHSLVASDFYIEQADSGYHLAGSPEDPPGHLTLGAPKFHLSTRKDGQPNVAFTIDGYHGRLAFGPAQFYIEPQVMPLRHTGTRPLDLTLWACSFYNTALAVEAEPAARVRLLGRVSVSDKLESAEVEETVTPESLAELAGALDDLRALGEVDLRVNHPHAAGR